MDGQARLAAIQLNRRRLYRLSSRLWRSSAPGELRRILLVDPVSDLVRVFASEIRLNSVRRLTPAACGTVLTQWGVGSEDAVYQGRFNDAAGGSFQTRGLPARASG